MNSGEANERLRTALKAELQRNFGRIAEIERELSRSDGYLSKYCRGELAIPVDVLLKSLELLNAHPGRFFSRALGAPLDTGDLLRGIAAQTADKPLARIQKAIDQLALDASGIEDASGVFANPFCTETAQKDQELVEAMLECSGIEQRRRLKTAKRYRRPGFVERYLKSLIPLCYNDPRTVTKQAETVVTELVPQIPDLDPEERLGLALKGLSLFGFSMRMIDQLEQSAAATHFGLRISSRFKMLPIQAELLRLGAYLLSDYGSYQEALQLLGQAIVIFDELDREVDVAKVQVQRGIVFNEVGDHISAGRALRKSLQRLPESDPTVARYRSSAFGELARACREAGDLHASQQWLNKKLDSLDASSGAFVRAKVKWEQGRLYYLRNQLNAAETCWIEARDLLFSCEAPDAVFVCLDLARLWLEQQRFREAVELSEGMARLLTCFRKNKIKEAALLGYIRAASEGRLSLMMVEALEKAMGEHSSSRMSA